MLSWEIFENSRRQALTGEVGPQGFCSASSLSCSEISQIKSPNQFFFLKIVLFFLYPSYAKESNSCLICPPYILVELLFNMVANFQECALERTQKESSQFLDLALRTGIACLEDSISQPITKLIKTKETRKNKKFTSGLDQYKTFGAIFTLVLNTLPLILFGFVIIVHEIHMSVHVYMWVHFHTCAFGSQKSMLVIFPYYS